MAQGLTKDLEGEVDIPALDISYDDALLPHIGDNVQEAIDSLKEAIIASGGFDRVIAQPADGTVITVLLPVGLIQPDTNYIPSMTLMSSGTITGFAIPKATLQTDRFIVETDAELPDGFVVGFQIRRKS